jgi:class 3 adenylate cyclase
VTSDCLYIKLFDPALLLKYKSGSRHSGLLPAGAIEALALCDATLPCGFRFRRVVAMHEMSPSRPFEPFRRARPGAFAAMQPTTPIRCAAGALHVLRRDCSRSFSLPTRTSTRRMIAQSRCATSAGLASEAFGLCVKMTDLQHWLKEIGLAQYSDLFAANDIDWEILPDLTEHDLEKLGVSLGHRKKLVKAIQARCGPLRDITLSVDPPPPAGAQNAERRHLTVLFCDLVGSTSLSAQLDPEELRKILFAFQRCCGDAIRRYEGHIARLMGDGVLAYFGFPSAHEDDAERAVKAALEIVQSVPALVIPIGGKLEVRIGIASGLVVVGDLIGEGPAREFALVGDAPNLASRLSLGRAQPDIGCSTHSAPLGGLLSCRSWRSQFEGIRATGPGVEVAPGSRKSL